MVNDLQSAHRYFDPTTSNDGNPERIGLNGARIIPPAPSSLVRKNWQTCEERNRGNRGRHGIRAIDTTRALTDNSDWYAATSVR
jgi:hypothetical protein